ncbi:MAG: META domain-containing protein [Pseudomonadota bacterium]
MKAVCLSLTLLSLIAQPANARDIRGVIPSDAPVVVEIWASDRTPLDRLDLPQGGAFGLNVPDGLDVELRAMAWTPGAAPRIAAPVPIEGGDDTVTLGVIDLSLTAPYPFPVHYLCEEQRIRTVFAHDGALISINGAVIPTTISESASGARYRSDGPAPVVFWTKGPGALLEVEGTPKKSCLLAVPTPATPYRAAGNEPFWFSGLDGAELEVTPNIGQEPRRYVVSEVFISENNLILRSTADATEMRIGFDICQDTMSGTPFPNSVTISGDGMELTGCGGDPYDLLTATAWRVTAIGGAALPQGVEPNFEFTADMRISGSSGCNRFSGPLEMTGESLTVGNAISTRRACPEPLMQSETAFFKALSAVTKFDISEDGNLLLIGAGGADAVIDARPVRE